LDEHHWLGHRMVGETMRYVAADANGEWVALVGFASPALSCGPGAASSLLWQVARRTSRSGDEFAWEQTNCSGNPGSPVHPT
ncbi:MAG: hypothetical protein ACYCX8_10950, partial [Acidimicrobiales bacterium]